MARVQILNEANEIAAGEKDFVQLRLETFVVTDSERDDLSFARYSPQMTIAGGRVLDNSAIKHRRKDVEIVRKYLSNLIEAERQSDKAKQLKIFLESAEERGLTRKDLQARIGWREEILKLAIAENVEKKAVIETENFYVARTPFENLKTETLAEIENFHRREPLAKGILRETLREKIFANLAPEIFKMTLVYLERENKIAAEKDTIRAAAHNLELSADETILRENLRKIYKDAKLEVPKLEDALNDSVRGTKLDKIRARKIFQLLLNAGEVVKISEEFYFAKTEIEHLTAKIRAFAASSADRLIEMAQFKDFAGISRKYAIPLLEYFDREKITRRAGDKRIIL